MNCTGKKFGYTACNIFVDTTDNPTCNEYDNPATDRTGVKTDADMKTANLKRYFLYSKQDTEDIFPIIKISHMSLDFSLIIRRRMWKALLRNGDRSHYIQGIGRFMISRKRNAGCLTALKKQNRISLRKYQAGWI